MSAYRRFISYMYDCRHGQKQKNCGFLKIEVRNNRCLIIFQLKNAPCQEKCNAYLCFRDADPEYVFLHSVPIHHGNAQFRFDTASTHMMGSSYSFSQCCGILCTDENRNDCCTCWDSVGELPVYKPPKSVSPEFSPELSPELSPEQLPSTMSEPASTTSASNLETEPDADPEPGPGPDPKPFSEKSPSIDWSTNFKEDSSTDISVPKPRTFTEIWKHMQQEFPALDPFEDNAIVEGIKVAPSDLGYLQSLDLELGTNQFLLHGYKNYQHLLMGRLHGQFEYVIGIPGVYDPQEQFMAKMFGFPCFKPIRECKQKNGQFGYWLHCFR